MKFIPFLFLLLSFTLFTFGCEDDPSDPCSGVTCLDGQECNEYTGLCVKKACSPEVPDGRCPSNQLCQAGVCIDAPCSAEFPAGVCPDGEICQAGTCIDAPCSVNNPNGSCPNGYYCNNGSCENITCSAENPNGNCPNGQECVNGSCQEVTCSSQFPEGDCPNDNETCLNGVCVDTSTLCSAENPNGDCPFGQVCQAGTCTNAPCSAENPDGTCPDGEYCARILDPETGEYSMECAAYDCSPGNINGHCPDGQICSTSGECVADGCNGECGPREICEGNECIDDPFFCNPNSLNGWCPTGFVCENGVCQEPVISPCDGVNCDAGYQCLIIDGEGVCTDNEEICSESNTTGLCSDGYICAGGYCVQGGACVDMNCPEGEVCNPNDGLCYDNICLTTTCSDPNEECQPRFGDSYPDGYVCLCKPGYDRDFVSGMCVENITYCTGVDCGEGTCQLDDYEPNGYYCECLPGMEYRDPPNRDFCIDPSTYNFCDETWNCDPGECVTRDVDGERYAECECPINYVSNPELKSCEPGVVCGINICNPLSEVCLEPSGQCAVQDCSEEFPEGDCGDSGYCLNGVCISGECSTMYMNGECMDGYHCRGGECLSDAPGPKLIGESCDLEQNNCVENGICLPDAHGDGYCYKLCDSSNNTCGNGETCVGQGVFEDANYFYIGVCAKDDNCNLANSDGCPYQEQVCLKFRNTSVTNCYYTGPRTLGESCSTLQATQLCGDDYLCVDGKCVPNCDRYNDDLDIEFCYNSFESSYNIEKLTLESTYFGEQTFKTTVDKGGVPFCDPSAPNTCSTGTCHLIQPGGDIGNSIGICAIGCNPAANPFRTECGDGSICFEAKEGVGGICLSGVGCDYYSLEGCTGQEICYPITDTASACMEAEGMMNPGDPCNYTDSVCQYGQCVEGICTTVCDPSDGDFECLFEGTCQATTDDYFSESGNVNGVFGICK